MSMRLSSEKQYLVLDNMKLVYYLVNKLNINQYSSEYEDLISIGTIGLIQAAITFDTSRNINFASYASPCINNKLFRYLKKAKKYANYISIDEPIGNKRENKEFTLGDTIEDPKSNFAEEIVKKEEYINLVSIILNCLEGKHRIALLYRIGNIPQREIADKMNISRIWVAKITEKAIQKVQKIASKQVHYKEVFSMSIVEDEYRISFLSKDISKFNKIFATLLQNLTSVEKLPDFTVNCNRERIIVRIPAHPESFSFIAQIIQEIDEFSMSFVSNKTTVPADDASTKRFETDTECISREVPDTNAVVESEKKVDETNSNSTVQKGSQIKQITEYMLSMDSFTVNDLKIHFPNLPVGTINSALMRGKSKGLITAISRGEYVVNKT